MTRPFATRIVALTVIVATSSLLSPAALAQAYVSESVCPDNSPVTFHRCALEAAQSFWTYSWLMFGAAFFFGIRARFYKGQDFTQ